MLVTRVSPGMRRTGSVMPLKPKKKAYRIFSWRMIAQGAKIDVATRENERAWQHINCCP